MKAPALSSNGSKLGNVQKPRGDQSKADSYKQNKPVSNIESPMKGGRQMYNKTQTMEPNARPVVNTQYNRLVDDV